MKKERGFYATRKRESRRSSRPPAWLWLAALIGLLLIVGATRAWSQSSEPRSSSSEETLQTWESISSRFRTELTGLRSELNEARSDFLAASGELKTSRTFSERLTRLYGSSLKKIDSLENYNAQIAERMQARDEDLADAYDDIARLKIVNLKLIIALIVAVVVIALLLIILIRR